jgi:hypothetical protein
MKVRLPLMVQDPVAIVQKGMTDPVEHEVFENEPFFLDGPITERVAILDLDTKTGELLPGAKFILPQGDKPGEYAVELPGIGSEVSREFIQISVLAIILKTMQIAENEAVLGRKLFWAFDAPQLLVIPQAGDWANAFYERDTHSLQFYFFGPEDSGRVYTSMSQDIVAHETAHAMLDGIAPDLYDALTPQSLALHEAFADLTAAIMAMHSQSLVETVLQQTGGALDQYTTAFNRIAEQFGVEQYGRHSLRDLSKKVAMDEVPTVEPHELSTVLSSALYELLIKTFEERRQQLADTEGQQFADPLFSVSGKALWLAVQQFARMIFRALDYLPPGEISFADYGRAILASDRVAFPDEGADRFREFLCEAFVARKIVSDKSGLDTQVNFEFPLSSPIDLDALVESDWVAYEFANRPDVRELLGIPRHVESFRIHPRLKTVKHFTAERTPLHDIVFKVSWDHVEDNNVNNGLPAKRRITAGSVLVINAEKSQDAIIEPEEAVLEVKQAPTQKRPSMPPYQSGDLRLRASKSGKNVLHVRARLSSDLEQQSERDQMLLHLLKKGVLEMEYGASAAGDVRRQSAIYARIHSNVLHVAGTARMLHIVT